MIIDSHAHSCGTFLYGKNIISELDKYQIEKAILVPGEFKSDKDYSLQNIAKLFPSRDVVRITNIITKHVIKLTKKINDIEKGNEYVYSLCNGSVKIRQSRNLRCYDFHSNERSRNGIKVQEALQSRTQIENSQRRFTEQRKNF